MPIPRRAKFSPTGKHEENGSAKASLSAGVNFFSEKKRAGRGLAVDTWTLCVRGEWRRRCRQRRKYLSKRSLRYAKLLASVAEEVAVALGAGCPTRPCQMEISGETFAELVFGARRSVVCVRAPCNPFSGRLGPESRTPSHLRGTAQAILKRLTSGRKRYDPIL